MKNIYFVENVKKTLVFSEQPYIVRIPAVENKNDLYLELAKRLNFPHYFGKNWDALIDMFRDLSWINNEKITIIHEGLSKLPKKDLTLYIEAILISLEFWNKEFILDQEKKNSSKLIWEPLHNIWFIFPESEEEQILGVIYEYMKTHISNAAVE